jgi:two-component system response regulator WspF
MKIAIVNDLAMAVVAIRQLLASTRHRVVWIAKDGAEAVSMCKEETPDLILMDLIMPVMDGVEATRRIMAATPCAILVVTATVEGNSSRVFEALGAGALDAVNTPVLAFGAAAGSSPLLKKIDQLERLLGDRRRPKTTPLPAAPAKPSPIGIQQNHLVAIGASAGGPMALAKVLSCLPADFPAAVVIVQHVDAQFAQGLADWLNHDSRLPVRLACEGDHPTRGTVLVAGTGDHLVFRESRALGYTSHPVSYVYRPSVDVFFESVVQHWRGGVIGVLLTGMGRDGAHGLKMLRDAGHHTMAQDRISSTVYGMPKAAAALGAAVEILPLEEIGPTLLKLHAPSSTPRNS